MRTLFLSNLEALGKATHETVFAKDSEEGLLRATTRDFRYIPLKGAGVQHLPPEARETRYVFRPQSFGLLTRRHDKSIKVLLYFVSISISSSQLPPSIVIERCRANDTVAQFNMLV